MNPKRGRPKLPKGKARPGILHIRLSDAERAAVEAKAKEQCKVLSEWARASMLAATAPEKGEPSSTRVPAKGILNSGPRPFERKDHIAALKEDLDAVWENNDVDESSKFRGDLAPIIDGYRRLSQR